MLEFIRALVDRGVLATAGAGNHGVDVTAGYREDVARCSAQIVLHAGGLLEFDFDLHNPRDLVGVVRHLVSELAPRKETDPRKVAQLLAKRGVLQVSANG